MRQHQFHVIVAGIFTFNLLISIFAAVVPSGFWAILALLAFIAFCLAMLDYRPASFVLLSPLLFLRLTEFISGVSIEYGAYINELAMFGEPTGAFARLCALYVLFFFLASSFTERTCRRVAPLMVKLPEKVTKISGFGLLTGFLFVALAYILSIGLRHGFPLIEGIDRFRFRLDLQDPVFTSFMGNRLIFVVLLGFFALDPRRRPISILAILSVFLTSVLYSEKFTSLALMLILCLTPRGLQIVVLNGALPRGKVISLPLLIGLFTIPIVLIVYGANTNPDAAFERLMSRISNQGQLWWAADRDYMTLFRLEAEPLLADLRSWLSPAAQSPSEVGTRFGLYYVMQAYAPTEITYYAGLQGTGYIFSLFPYLLMTTGLIGVVAIGLLTHLVYAVIVSWLAEAIMKGTLIRLVIASKLFIFVVSGGFVTGFLWSFFGFKTLLLISLYLTLRSSHSLDRTSAQKGLRLGA